MEPILIVDDEKDNLEALQRLLRNQYKVTVTTSPFEALKLVQKGQFNVIISDQRMPEMTGVELLEKIKNIEPLSTRILLTGYTDITSVIDAINRGNIYRYIAKPWDPEELKLTLRQANEAYHLRAEIEESNAELRKALDALRLLDRAKARFLSLVSHELNTPLTVLQSFVALLSEEKEHLPKEMQRAVGGLSEASHRFSEIVSEVLTYVQLESDDQLHLQKFDVEKEINKLKKSLHPECQKKKLTIEVEVKSEVEWQCDPEKMRVALRKLLQDTILHSPSDHEIKISLSDGRLSVWRSGKTLSPEAFAPLAMVGETLHHQRNLGLALAICKLIVESHGGQMELASKQTTGTTIRVAIP